MRLEVENRHDFTDLSELRFEWKLGERSGTARGLRAAGQQGHAGNTRRRGENSTASCWKFAPSARAVLWKTFGRWRSASIRASRRRFPPMQPGAVKLEKTADAFVIRSAEFTVTVDAKTGMLKATGKNGKPSLLSGPELLLLPANGDLCGGMQMSGMEKDVAIFTDACHDWKATVGHGQRNRFRRGGPHRRRICRGKGILRVDVRQRRARCRCIIAFTVTEKGKCDPRQIGVVFGLPGECQTLSWRRKAFWSSYPDDHIGRPQGTATAFENGLPLSGLAGPRVEPNWSWSRDGSKHGTNDFRSTKMNVIEASLLSTDRQRRASALRRFAARPQLGGWRPRAASGGRLCQRRCAALLQ